MTIVVKRYFDAFNAKNYDAMIACLADDVVHHVNEGGVRTGKQAFAEFCAHMDRCYDEHLTNIVLMRSDDGSRAAAEYVVTGTYKSTDAGLPEAKGQNYTLPAGSFFTLRDGLICRVTTRYNLSDWTAQVA